MKKLVVTKCKDQTFIVSNGRTIKTADTNAELTALLYWFYEIKKSNTLNALNILQLKNDDMMEINLNTGKLITTSKINYSDAYDDDWSHTDYDDE